MRFEGRHYETGTVANALAAMGVKDPQTGKPYSEALALGASGGIAFGYFVFEYKGFLPHVALLGRNTFSPFERMLDNLAIRREARETIHADKAEKNLRLELDSGNIPIVWADMFSMPYRGLNPEHMWTMIPMAVVGQEGDDFLVLDGSSRPIRVSAETLSNARARVKKDRFRMTILEAPDSERIGEGLRRGIGTCTALFLDKPPAGSANNFGIAGMRHFSKMLTDGKNSKGWAKTFQPGPRLTQALAGSHGQPGVWDWIERWGTEGSADRATYAQFLREASVWLGIPLNEVAGSFNRSAAHWSALAEAAMPDIVSEFARLKEIKRALAALWFEDGEDSNQERGALRKEMKELTQAVGAEGRLDPFATEIQANMAAQVDQIAELEGEAFRLLRSLVE